MKKLLDVVMVLDNLSRIPRTGGVVFSGIDPNRTDSISEHIYKVTFLCLLLGKIAQKKGSNLDLDKVIQKSITHDWSDSVLLDLPTGSPSFKSYFDDIDIRSEYKKAEKKVRVEIMKYVKDIVELNLDEELSEVEEQLLIISDNIALLLEIIQWKNEGMRHEWFDYVWSNTYKRLLSDLRKSYDFLMPFAEELQKAYHSGVRPTNPFLTKPEHQSFRK